MIGRSHGIHAEPVTFGVALAGHLAEMKRGRARLRDGARPRSRSARSPARSAPTRTCRPRSRRARSARSASAPETVATQVVARDRHAAFFAALAVVAAGIERLATNVRHWQRTEVGEAEERFTAGQKGSSAMPHKRNPILSENLCGLARVVRAAALARARERRALARARHLALVGRAHDRARRDDHARRSCSSAPRRWSRVSSSTPRRFEANLERTGGLFFSEAVLLALVEKGMAAARGVRARAAQRHAGHRGRGRFRENLAGDADVTRARRTEQTSRAASISSTPCATPENRRARARTLKQERAPHRGRAGIGDRGR